MTAFDPQEHAMMRGIWGELEALSHIMRDILGVLERQEQAVEIVPDAAAEVAPGVWEDRLDEGRIIELTQANRRRLGLCLSCGATPEMAEEQYDFNGRGCYEWNPGGQWRKVWAPHSWPEDAPLG